MNWLEIIGVVLGVVYLLLEYRASAWLWVPSIAMPAVYLDVYYRAGLYADFAISIYYIVASVYGLICWLRHPHNVKGEAATERGQIIHTPRSAFIPLVGIFVALFVVIGLLLDNLTDSTVPWGDALTTALSIVAMWMLARKYVEQWLVWILTDIGCTVLYAYKGLWFTSALYLSYAVIAVAGYRKWLRMTFRP